MQTRVECERCRAHKDEAVWPGPCLVCGYYSFRPVPLNDADRRALEASGDDAGAEDSAA